MNTPSKDIFVNRIPGLLERKRPAHGVYISDSKPTIVFITVCTKDRQPWLADEEYHGILLELWSDSSAWIVGRYVIMPDHIHLLLIPKEKYSLSNIMKGIKGVTARKINIIRRTSGSVWQNESFDRIIRDEDELNEKLNYMLYNPVKKNLTENPWRYHGWYLNDNIEIL